MPRRGQPVFFGWYVAANAVLIYFFTNGMTLIVPQNLFPRFMESFGATAAEISRTTAITLLIAAVLAPFVGAIVDRFGVLRVIRTGLVVLATGLSVYPFTQTLSQLYLVHALLAVGLVLAGLMPNVVLLSNWFVSRRGAVVGMLAAGSSLAGGVLPLVISPLVNDPEYGWRWGFGVLSTAFWLLAVVPGFLVLRESPASVGQYPDGAPAPQSPRAAGGVEGVAFGAALRTRTLWCLALGSACLWYCMQALNSQITIFFETEAGLVPERATLLYSVIFWLSFCGKFLFGYISDRFPKRHVMQVTSGILLAGTLLLFELGPDGPELTRQTGRLVAFAVVFGLGFGGSFSLIQLVAVESFGQRALGKILGIVTFVDAIGATAGTLLTGQLRTSMGGYFGPFAIVVVVAVVALVNVLLIRPVPFTASSAQGRS